MSFAKQNNIKHTDFMTRCGLSLANNPEVPADSTLSWLIRFIRIGDRAHEALSNINPEVMMSDPLCVQATLDGLAAELEQCRRELPTGLKSLRKQYICFLEKAYPNHH
jgi:hypothetical protein